ncbi:hypothetical protein Bca52824_007102 [Brassica carinata]|uniref:Uncharacterized protein n=1 Tax=Brassica carinata TaxID=52824 RepID=A0A8X7W5N5_BRACI|nr:hypothetical protein Bca52824_007102 [Brassica carinata]
MIAQSMKRLTERKLAPSQQTPFKETALSNISLKQKVGQAYDPFAFANKKMSEVLTAWLKLDPFKMSGSIDLKRKRPMEEDYAKPRRGLRQGEAAATNGTGDPPLDRFARGDAPQGDQFDIRRRKPDSKRTSGVRKEDVKAIKVPFVDWEKLGEGWFWSQP